MRVWILFELQAILKLEVHTFADVCLEWIGRTLDITELVKTTLLHDIA